MPLRKQAEVKEKLYNMQGHVVTEKSDSPWSSPIDLVRKNGELRFSVDYRKINVSQVEVQPDGKEKTGFSTGK
jgi:hypothetical protein